MSIEHLSVVDGTSISHIDFEYNVYTMYAMKSVLWDLDKNTWLKLNRGFGFEEVLEAIGDGRLLDDLPNPSRNFPNQRVFVVEICDYAVVVPYVEDRNAVFLKTMYADRKATRKYMKGLNQ